MPEEVKVTKVLSVEDDEFIRLFLKDVMWIHGAKDNIEFEAATNINKAKALIDNPETRPQIVFLDLMLPQEEGGSPDINSGINLLEKIKTDPDLMKIKVLVFSSVKDNDIREKVTRLGADRYMVKGEYMPTELIAAVQEIIKQL